MGWMNQEELGSLGLDRVGIEVKIDNSVKFFLQTEFP